MIYITGDTHGKFSRFAVKRFPIQKKLTKDDYVIICGDFGIWNDSKQERYNFKWLNERSYTTLFVEGNHSNYDLLAQYPVKKWHGGDVHFINDSIIHLMRGQVYDIDGRSFFTMGGAASHDIRDGILDPYDRDFASRRRRLDMRYGMYRINRMSWWEEELPSQEEYQTVRRNLDACNWSVDYIVSHCAPTSIQSLLGTDIYKPDKLTDFFDEVKDRCQFSGWCFGHYHDNRTVDRKYHLMYEQIIPLDIEHP